MDFTEARDNNNKKTLKHKNKNKTEYTMSESQQHKDEDKHAHKTTEQNTANTHLLITSHNSYTSSNMMSSSVILDTRNTSGT